MKRKKPDRDWSFKYEIRYFTMYVSISRDLNSINRQIYVWTSSASNDSFKTKRKEKNRFWRYDSVTFVSSTARNKSQSENAHILNTCTYDSLISNDFSALTMR